VRDASRAGAALRAQHAAQRSARRCATLCPPLMPLDCYEPPLPIFRLTPDVCRFFTPDAATPFIRLFYAITYFRLID
jgi:hypothetical protein